jgi:hypothetical protein
MGKLKDRVTLINKIKGIVRQKENIIPHNKLEPEIKYKTHFYYDRDSETQF